MIRRIKIIIVLRTGYNKRVIGTKRQKQIRKEKGIIKRTETRTGEINLHIDTVSNLVFCSRLANKLGPWHNVYIIRQ